MLLANDSNMLFCASCFHLLIWLTLNSNSWESSARVLCSFKASKATRALNDVLYLTHDMALLFLFASKDKPFSFTFWSCSIFRNIIGTVEPWIVAWPLRDLGPSPQAGGDGVKGFHSYLFSFKDSSLFTLHSSLKFVPLPPEVARTFG